MDRIMAIDYGDARTGIAISDALGFGTGTAETIASWQEDAVVARIGALAAQHQVSRLVVGQPRNMDGSLGERAELCAGLARRLEEETHLPVTLWDERRTTVDAHRILSQTGKKQKKHKASVDAVAASLILEGYLGWLRHHETDPAPSEGI